MEGQCPDRSLVGSDDCYICDRKSVRMVRLLTRTGSTMLEDRARVRAVHDHGLRYRIALWTQRGRIRLLVRDDVMAHSADFMVYTWYNDFLPGYSVRGEPTASLKHLGWSARLRSAADQRRIRLSFAPASFRK